MELIDEIGYGLYARCKDFIRINQYHMSDIILCMSCDKEVVADNNLVFNCACGWSMTQLAYLSTYQKKQYVGITVVPFAEKFIADWHSAGDSYSAKMRAIDYLIHCFHFELTEQRTTRPAAINFIEGKLEDIIDMILELAYGDDYGVYTEEMERWINNAKRSEWLGDMIDEKRKRITNGCVNHQ